MQTALFNLATECAYTLIYASFTYWPIYLHRCACMCLYVPVCTHVCMYLCMYVCMYLGIQVSRYLGIYVPMYLCNYVRMYVCMYVQYVCVCTYVCTGVQIYLDLAL